MGWMPGAAHRPLDFADKLPARSGPDTVILHTNGGGAALFGWFNRPDNQSEQIAAHFQVFADGRIEQYIDTARVAYAQFDGNRFGISVETEDDGNPATPWTDAQLSAIHRITAWVGVPARLAPAGGGGIGYHSQYTAWNHSGHDCPGSVRRAQITSHIIPALTAGPTTDWFDEVTEQEFTNALTHALAPIVAKLNTIADEVHNINSNPGRTASAENLISTAAARLRDEKWAGTYDALAGFIRDAVAPAPEAKAAAK